MKKIFILTFMLMMIAANCSATIHGDDNPEILEDMYKNPSNYVNIGTENFGLSYYLAKNTINVEKYAPPNYIISFKMIYHLLTPDRDRKIKVEYAGYANNSTIRYKYDYSSRKMQIEKYDENNNPYWSDVDVSPITPEKSKKMNGQDFRNREREIGGGEIAFYLAYKMSFFDNPIIAKDFINDGRSKMIPLLNYGLPKLKHTSDKQLSRYEYNHNTNQIELWQYTYNDSTKDFSAKKIK